jgi:hypothetical protein
MANLDIRLTNGRTLTIGLYYTFGGRGAFSIHPDYPESSWNSGLMSHYFRGGNDRRIHDALVNAYRASQQK